MDSRRFDEKIGKLSSLIKYNLEKKRVSVWLEGQ